MELMSPERTKILTDICLKFDNTDDEQIGKELLNEEIEKYPWVTSDMVHSKIRKLRAIERAKILTDICLKVDNADDEQNGKELLNEEIKKYPWVTRFMVHSKIRRMRSLFEEKATNTVLDDMVIAAEGYVKGGRPIGTTTLLIDKIESKKIDAKNDIAMLVKKKKKKNGNGRLGKHEYKNIHDSVLNKHCLNALDPTFLVPRKTINSRLRRGNLKVDRSNSNPSPMAKIEPIILRFTV